MPDRNPHDFYATNPNDVEALARFIDRIGWEALTRGAHADPLARPPLYPCAGGISGVENAPYPDVFDSIAALPPRRTGPGRSFDIRPDSDAQFRVDFLADWVRPRGHDLAIDNPPFKLYRQFVEKALELCEVVVFLLPMQSREPRVRTYDEDVEWWRRHRPTSIVTHPRLKFSGAKSSAFQEYAHMFWVRQLLGHTEPIQLFAIDDGPNAATPGEGNPDVAECPVPQGESRRCTP